jgi:hypothetical protein
VVTKEYDKESGEDGERERGKRDFPSYPSVRSLCAKINKWNKGDATIFPLGPNALVPPMLWYTLLFFPHTRATFSRPLPKLPLPVPYLSKLGEAVVISRGG